MSGGVSKKVSGKNRSGNNDTGGKWGKIGTPSILGLGGGFGVQIQHQ